LVAVSSAGDAASRADSSEDEAGTEARRRRPSESATAHWHICWDAMATGSDAADAQASFVDQSRFWRKGLSQEGGYHGDDDKIARQKSKTKEKSSHKRRPKTNKIQDGVLVEIRHV